MQSTSTLSALLLPNAENNFYLSQSGVDMPLFTSEIKAIKPAAAKKIPPKEITIFESIENETENDEGQREVNDVDKHTPHIPEIVEKHVREKITLFLHSIKNHAYIFYRNTRSSKMFKSYFGATKILIQMKT